LDNNSIVVDEVNISGNLQLAIVVIIGPRSWIRTVLEVGSFCDALQGRIASNKGRWETCWQGKIASNKGRWKTCWEGRAAHFYTSSTPIQRIPPPHRTYYLGELLFKRVVYANSIRFEVEGDDGWLAIGCRSEIRA
jgi:hypothetical protein